MERTQETSGDRENFRTTPIGKLPSDWRVCRLDELVDARASIRYGVVQIGENTPGGVPIIPIKHLDRIDTAELHEASCEIESKYANSRVRGGDVLISVKGTIGRVGIVPPAFEGNIAREIARIRTNGQVDPLYLSLQLQAGDTQRRIERATVGTTRREFSISAVKTFEIALPPLEEQRLIGKVISTWDRAIETVDKQIETARAQKKALMQQLLTGKRRLPGFEGAWASVAIGKLLKEVRRDVEWSDDANYRLLSVRRRSGGAFLREVLCGHQIKTKLMRTARYGDFLISKMQVVHGATGLVSKELDGSHISGSYISMVARDPERFDIRFIDWLSRTKRFRHQTYLSSYGVHIEKMTFSLPLFLKEEISIPPSRSEMAEIANLLDESDQEIALLERQRSLLAMEKRALMQQLLTGKRRVNLGGASA